MAVWRRLRRDPVFVTSAAVVLLWVLVAIGWRWIVPYDPYAVDPAQRLLAPSGQHWLGTDNLGRDMFSRMLAGAETVLVIAPIATVLALAAGVGLGLVAGYHGGVVDGVIMRVVDALLSFPAIILTVVVVAVLGSSTVTLVLVVAGFFAPPVARVVRGAVLGEREREYVQAALLQREHPAAIMFREVLPNVTSPILVEGTVRFGYAILAIGTMSFLQLGLQEPSPDWGLSIALSRLYLQQAPWMTIGPSFGLVSLVVAVTLASDSLATAMRVGVRTS